MATDDPASRYLAMKERGASPAEIYTAARMHDLKRDEAIRILRDVCGLSPAQAEAVVASVEGPAPFQRTVVDSREQLIAVLKDELGYCDCASDEAIAVLRDFLQAAQERSDAVDDETAFGRASRALEAVLPLDAAPGFACWFVYGMQQRGLIWHGFNMTDVWITDKGRWLLKAMHRFMPAR